MLLIKNCNLFSMADIAPDIYDILVDGGKIIKIDKSIRTDNKDIQIVDAQGKMVTPGLIEPHAHTAMADSGGGHINEITGPIQSYLRGCDAVDLKHHGFKEALLTGVTTLAIGPGSSNLIGGTFMAVKSGGENIDKRVITNELSMKMALGENPKMNYSKINKSPSTRMGAVALIRESLYKAKNYREKYLESQKNLENGEESSFAYDLKLHALMKVFDGLMVKIHAHQAVDIYAAIRIGEEFGLKYSIEHCTEGHMMIDELQTAKAKVIVGPLMGGKGKFEMGNKTLELPAILEHNGIEFAITTDNGVIPMYALLTQACLFVKNGLSEMGALKAMTLNAARAIGLEDRIGSIEAGKSADIVIWDEGPLRTMSKINTVIIDGEVQCRNGEVLYDYYKC